MKARAKKIDVLIDSRLRHVKVNDENVPSLFDSENGGGVSSLRCRSEKDTY